MKMMHVEALVFMFVFILFPGAFETGGILSDLCTFPEALWDVALCPVICCCITCIHVQ